VLWLLRLSRLDDPPFGLAALASEFNLMNFDEDGHHGERLSGLVYGFTLIFGLRLSRPWLVLRCTASRGPYNSVTGAGVLSVISHCLWGGIILS